MRVTSAALLALSAAAAASSATPTAPASHTVHVPIITNNGTGPQKHSLRVDPELTVPEIEEMAADFCTSHSVDQTHVPAIVTEAQRMRRASGGSGGGSGGSGSGGSGGGMEASAGSQAHMYDGDGWRGPFKHDHPRVTRLRQHLQRHNCIHGLQTVTVTDAASAAVAADLFHRDGFVVLADVLPPGQLSALREASVREVAKVLAKDPLREGNRGSHRYSFGSASGTGHLMHVPEWTELVDLPPVTKTLTAIWGSPEYVVRGGGGEFTLPGAVLYQDLHSDISDRRVIYDRVTGETLKTLGSFYDPSGRLTLRDLPVPFVVANFPLVDLTAENGPTRQVRCIEGCCCGLALVRVESGSGPTRQVP
jgi:hypothetical protein